MITIATKTAYWAHGGSGATLEFYASEDFRTAQGVAVFAGDIQRREPSLLPTITCSVSSGILTIPEITIPATTDSIDNENVKYTAILYAESGQKEIFLEDFFVSEILTNATWTAIINENLGRTLPYNTANRDLFPTVPQMNIAISEALTGIALDSLIEGEEGDRIVFYDDAWTTERNSLENLTDVNIVTPEDGNVLTWDTATSKWVADEPAVGDSLPSQAGNAGKLLSTNGSAAIWTSLANPVEVDFVEELEGNPDGVTSNTSAFAAAMALNANRYRLYLPEGDFLTGKITWNPSLNIRGAGRRRFTSAPGRNVPITRIISSAATPLIEYVANDYLDYASGILEDFELDGNEVGTIGLNLQGIQKWLFRRLYINNFTQIGAKILGSLVGTFDHFLFINNPIGAYLDEHTFTGDSRIPSNFVTFRSCHFFNADEWAVKAFNLSTLLLDNCNIESCGTNGDDETGGVWLFGGEEAIALKVVDAYIERISGLAQFLIQTTASTDVRFIFDSVQAYMRAGTAKYGIAIEQLDGFATQKRRIIIQNSYIEGTLKSVKAINSPAAEIVSINSDLPDGVDVPSSIPFTEIKTTGEINLQNLLTTTAPIQPARLSRPDITEMASDWGASDRGKLFFDRNSNQWCGWDGADVVAFTTETPDASPSPDTLFSTSFTGTNGTAIASHTPPIGDPMSAESGNWQIQSNTLEEVGDAVAPAVCVTQELGSANYKVTAIYNPGGGSGRYSGVVVRYLNPNYYTYVQFREEGGTKTLKLIDVQVAASFVASESYSWTDSTDHTVVILCAGNQITVTVEGVERFGGAQTTLNLLGEKAGIIKVQTSENPVLNNLVITEF